MLYSQNTRILIYNRYNDNFKLFVTVEQFKNTTLRSLCKFVFIAFAGDSRSKKGFIALVSNFCKLLDIKEDG